MNPFKGVLSARPYPATGLTTARWINEVPVLGVPFHILYLTQDGVRITPLFGITGTHASTDRYPHVVAWAGQLWLEDGHHRVVRAALVEHVDRLDMRVYHHTDGTAPTTP